MKSLYFHIPFCVHKCFYCDFYSITESGYHSEFTEALCNEINLRFSGLPDSTIAETIYFGGGTPSLLGTSFYENIFNSIRSKYQIINETEVTIECNPGTIDPEKLKALRESGFNRISLGIQSFNDDELHFLQRIHNSEEAKKSFSVARNAGFDNISIDLMFSLPGQTEDSLKYTIDEALMLEPDNISFYSLIYEEGTPLYDNWKADRINKLADDTDASFYKLIINRLSMAGYNQYEISNFSKKGKESKHNLVYWHCGEYLGFGPSAHGYYQGRRYWNVRNLKKYIQTLNENQLPEDGSEILTMENKIQEFIYLAIRADGIDARRLKSEFGLNFGLADLLSDFIDSKMIKNENSIFSLTKKGYMLCDEIALILMNRIEKVIYKK